MTVVAVVAARDEDFDGFHDSNSKGGTEAESFA